MIGDLTDENLIKSQNNLNKSWKDSKLYYIYLYIYTLIYSHFNTFVWFIRFTSTNKNSIILIASKIVEHKQIISKLIILLS